MTKNQSYIQISAFLQNTRLAKLAAYVVQVVASWIGSLAGNPRRAEGPYYLLERTKRWQRATPIQASTLHEARLVALTRVAQLAKNGWNCNKVTSEGALQQGPGSIVTWLCQNHGPKKWVSVECGAMPVEQPDEWAFDVEHRGEFTMTAAQITDACKTWAMFNGFSGEHCGHCLTDQNVLAGGPGFICPTCGHHNVMSWSHSQMPHKHPEFGPTARVIRAGIRQHRINEGELREDGTEVPFSEWPRVRMARQARLAY